MRCINTTEPQTIKKGWEKTRLTESFDFDRELENEDAEEEFLLQCGMEELNLDSESETESDDVIEMGSHDFATFLVSQQSCFRNPPIL